MEFKIVKVCYQTSKRNMKVGCKLEYTIDRKEVTVMRSVYGVPFQLTHKTFSAIILYVCWLLREKKKTIADEGRPAKKMIEFFFKLPSASKE